MRCDVSADTAGERERPRGRITTQRNRSVLACGPVVFTSIATAIRESAPACPVLPQAKSSVGSSPPITAN